MSADLPSGLGKPNTKLEASEDRNKRNKQFFIGRILILVRRLNQIRE
jgi:hypothetical protein